VLCDWCMAEMDGLEVCRQFKQDPALASIFFILLTSRSALEDRVRGLDAGADDFLTKPVEPSELLARVRSGLRLFRANRDLRALSIDLAAQKQKLEEELSSAADYVSSILPTGLSGDVRIESLFRPSQKLGGDCLDYYWLDENRLVLYVLDVSDHGLAAALPSISVHNLLRSRVLSEQVLADPAAVLGYLNRCFQMGRQHEQYFTMWYGIYDRSLAQLHYSSAGHPPAFLFSPAAEHKCSLRELKAPGMPIGLFEEALYKAQVCRVEPGALLCVFSDGLYEIPTESGPMWSYEAFRALLKDQVEQGSVSIQGSGWLARNSAPADLLTAR
jgi:phosphoserine phosphatase RsbU/P